MKVKLASLILGEDVRDILAKTQTYKDKAEEFKSRQRLWSQKKRTLKRQNQEKEQHNDELTGQLDSIKAEIEQKRGCRELVDNLSQIEQEIQATEEAKGNCLNEVNECQHIIDTIQNELEQLKVVQTELTEKINMPNEISNELQSTNEEIVRTQNWLRENSGVLTQLEQRINNKLTEFEQPTSVEVLPSESPTGPDDDKATKVIEGEGKIVPEKTPVQVPDDVSAETERKKRNHKIKEILDLETGDTINADEFFSQPIAELEKWRTIFQECISQGKRRFVCPNCLELIRISGRGDERGVPSIFTHKNDSVYCHKTTQNISEEEINRRKYSLVGQSTRHKELKQLIYNCLIDRNSAAIGVENVEIEKRVKSSLPFFNWRQPDVQIEYQGKKIVFEIQLSTTFVSVITERDTFYRLNEYYILWIFNFEDNRKYVNLSNLAMKDIYFANKLNAFIFDEDARQWSKEKEQLVLKCNWLDPDMNWHHPNINGKFGGEPVTLDLLKFDPVTFKPYYFDAETPYLEKHPEQRETFAKEQRTREDHIRELEQQIQDKEAKRQEAIQQMMLNGGKVIAFKEKNHYGFKYGTTVIVEPHFTSCEQREDGTFIVGYNRKKGIVNQYGEFVVPCESPDLRCFSCGLIIYRIKDEKGENWHILYNDDFCISFEKQDDWTEKIAEQSAIAIQLHNPRLWRSNTVYCWNEMFFINKSYRDWCIYDKYGNRLNERSYTNIEIIDKTYARVIHEGKKGYINNKAEEVPLIFEFPDGFKREVLSEKYCLISPQGEKLCEYIYDSIDYFSEGRYIISNVERILMMDYGWERKPKFPPKKIYYIVDKDFHELSIKYTKIDPIIDGKAYAYKGTGPGLDPQTGKMNFNGEVFTLSDRGIMIPNVEIPILNGNKIVAYGDVWKWTLKEKGEHALWTILNEKGFSITDYYKELQDIGEGRIIAKKHNRKAGVITYDGTVLMPCEYDTIKLADVGGIKLLAVRKYQKCGIFDLENHQIISIEFDNILWYKKWKYLVVEIRREMEKDNKYGRRVRYNKDFYGLYDTNGKQYLEPIYSKITIDNDGVVHFVHNAQRGHLDAHGNVEFEESVPNPKEETKDVVIKKINTDKGFIIVASGDKTIFIHKSWLINSDNLEGYNVGNPLKIVHSGYDKIHKKNIWKETKEAETPKES